MKLYDHPDISQLYFFPRPTPPFVASQHYQPLQFAIDGIRVGAVWCRFHEQAPTILFFYGNGETASDYIGTSVEDWVRDANANLLLVDYPGYGTSTGEPSLSGCCMAADAALSFLLDHDEAEVPNVIIMGRSVGSIFALDVAYRRGSHPNSDRVSGLILESGIADLAQRLDIRVPYEAWGISRSEFHQQLAEDFDHHRKISEATLPALVLHCTHDSLVPCWHAEQLAEWAGPNLWKVVKFADGDHNTIHGANAAHYQAELAAFLEQI